MAISAITVLNSDRDAAFIAGVDTHADTHTIAILDLQGRVIDTRTFQATVAGYQDTITWLTNAGACHGIEVEGTNSYGAGLTRQLLQAGYTVSEVLRPARQVRRMDGKSDPIDAIEAARCVLTGKGLSVPKATEGPAEALRYLHACRHRHVLMMRQISTQVQSLLVTAPNDIREKYRDLPTRELLQRLASCRARQAEGFDLNSIVLISLKTLARTWIDCANHAAEIENRMHEIITEYYPAMLDIYGARTICAAALIITAGDNPERITSEAAFAKMCGACPLPASSGKTTRHRLNRGGHRDANHALHIIAVIRMGRHQPTRDYVTRQRAKGKSNPEILRQIKRALCREIYRTLTHPARTLTPGAELKTLRRSKHISQIQAATAIGTIHCRISDIEHDKRPAPELRKKYETWLKTA